ncbi:hypothetical protein KVMX100_110109 [Klebsiella variicola]|nr:dATP/dGTP pyrophosphohydrolase domain-containing protein [Klebsiella variicola]SBM88877.1 hypothetical protein KVMX100_110109 [Klebsiella variicola]
MTSKFTREELLNIINTDHVQCGEASALARMALAAMDQKPAIHRYRRKAVEPYGPYPWHYEEFVDLSRPLEGIEDEYYYAAPPVITGFAVDGESECLPLDYLQGHKDGLEWAAQLAEANHPETGDWLYDDPIELAKAIRKGPDMPPAQSVDSEPVAIVELSDYVTAAQLVGEGPARKAVHELYEGALRIGDKLYRHAQPAPEYPETLPCPVLLEPGLRFGKGIKTSTMLAALSRRSVYESDLAALSPEEKAEFQAGIEDVKALIAQPAPVVPDERDKAVDADDHPLLWDAQRRAGITDEQITQAMIDKLAVNKQRSWPEPKDGEPRLHIKEQPAPVAPVVPDFKKLARELVDNLVDCGGLDEGVKEKYLEWAEKTCRAAMLAATPQEVK